MSAEGSVVVRIGRASLLGRDTATLRDGGRLNGEVFCCLFLCIWCDSVYFCFFVCYVVCL